MANYSTSSYSLEFSGDYKTLKVMDSLGVLEASYPLDNGDESVSLTVADGEYVVEVADDFDPPTHKISAPACAGVTISLAQMEGIGILDLRDVNKSGNFNVEYDLECTTYYLKYKSGAEKPLWLQFDNSNECYDYTEL